MDNPTHSDFCPSFTPAHARVIRGCKAKPAARPSRRVAILFIYVLGCSANYVPATALELQCSDAHHAVQREGRPARRPPVVGAAQPAHQLGRWPQPLDAARGADGLKRRHDLAQPWTAVEQHNVLTLRAEPSAMKIVNTARNARDAT